MEIHNRLNRHGQDAEDVARGQAREHVIMEMGWSDTRMPMILVNLIPAHHGDDVTDEVDGSCVEILGNEGWLAKY